jgi:hypothetical protein
MTLCGTPTTEEVLTMTAVSNEDSQLLCPSARCEPDALLLGFINSSGTVAYIRPALKIDPGFVAKVRTSRRAEDRFRFAAPCAKDACIHWKGAKCGVIDKAISAAEAVPSYGYTGRATEKCGVRSRCRWFTQSGFQACEVCPFVFNYVWPVA